METEPTVNLSSSRFNPNGLPKTLVSPKQNMSSSSSSNFVVESYDVDSEEGVKLHTRIFKPRDEQVSDDGDLAIVLVHPFSLLGGCQALLKGIASELACKGFKAVTLDTRGAGKSTGRATLTGFAEVKDVIAVCRWVSQNLGAHRILLVGSSAGKVSTFPSKFSVWTLLG